MSEGPRTYTSVLTETAIRFADHMGRLAELPSREFRVHFEALMWCTLNDLPLRVEKVHVVEFAQSEDPAPAVAELVRLGWWVEGGDHWNVGGRHAETLAEEAEDIADAEAALADPTPPIPPAVDGPTCDGCGDPIPADAPHHPEDMTGTGRLCVPCFSTIRPGPGDVLVTCRYCPESTPVQFYASEIGEHRQIAHPALHASANESTN